MPQAKRHEPSLLVTSLAISTSYNKTMLLFHQTTIFYYHRLSLFNSSPNSLSTSSSLALHCPKLVPNSQELRMLSHVAHIEGWQWLLRLLFSNVRNLMSVSMLFALWDCSTNIFVIVFFTLIKWIKGQKSLWSIFEGVL